MYTIGQVSQMFDLPVSTLRYYDKMGLLPGLARTSGTRRFDEEQLEALRSCGVELVQGYLFSKHIPTSEYEEKYLKS